MLTHPIRRILTGALLAAAVVAAPWWAGDAMALTKIKNVRIAPTEADAGAESSAIPAASSSAWALFDYVDANNRAKITVVVVNDGGDPLLSVAAPKYSGNGTGKVEISAAALVRGAADRVETLCEDIQAMAELGDGTSVTDGEVLDARTSIERDLRALSRIMVPMDRAELTGDALAAKNSIDQLFPQAQAALDDLVAIAITDVAAMRNRLKTLVPVATDLAEAGVALSSAVADTGDFTMAALRTDAQPYTVSVKIDEIGMGPAVAGSADLTVVVGGKGTESASALGTPAPSATPRMPSTYQGNDPGSAARQNTPNPTARTDRSPETNSGGKSAPTGATPNPADPKAQLQAQMSRGTTQPPAVSTLRAASTAVSLGTSLPSGIAAAGTAVAADASASGDAAAPELGGAPAGGQGGVDAGGAPLPTFTVPAYGVPQSGPTEPASGRGPNLLVLAGGIVVLIGLALWFRRRL